MIQERVGLTNTRARVEALNGSLSYGATADGFVARILIPFRT
jgi:signal transduction histidine kinase